MRWKTRDFWFQRRLYNLTILINNLTKKDVGNSLTTQPTSKKTSDNRGILNDSNSLLH